MPRAGLAGQVLLRGLQEVQVCANDREGRRRTSRESAMLFIVSKECMCICACTALWGGLRGVVLVQGKGVTESKERWESVSRAHRCWVFRRSKRHAEPHEWWKRS